ncbi:MAG TPA: F0F1 ATP synthase subunit C [Candidatus Thermoplasmatota archaeon]|nr:F0F1 ATP synthase subunit C [Candidatus Thermoplasmatota archaeon]
MNTNNGMLALLGLALTLIVAGNAAAQGEAEGARDNTEMGLAIGAGLAIGLAGVGTGLAQQGIGAAAVGAIAEDAGFLGKAILFVAIPETIIIFGFVVAFLLFGKIA